MTYALARSATWVLWGVDDEVMIWDDHRHIDQMFGKVPFAFVGLSKTRYMTIVTRFTRSCQG